MPTIPYPSFTLPCLYLVLPLPYPVSSSYFSHLCPVLPLPNPTSTLSCLKPSIYTLIVLYIVWNLHYLPITKCSLYLILSLILSSPFFILPTSCTSSTLSVSTLSFHIPHPTSSLDLILSLPCLAKVPDCPGEGGWLQLRRRVGSPRCFPLVNLIINQQILQ